MQSGTSSYERQAPQETTGAPIFRRFLVISITILAITHYQVSSAEFLSTSARRTLAGMAPYHQLATFGCSPAVRLKQPRRSADALVGQICDAEVVAKFRCQVEVFVVGAWCSGTGAVSCLELAGSRAGWAPNVDGYRSRLWSLGYTPALSRAS